MDFKGSVIYTEDKWYSVHAQTCRFFVIGEYLEAGEMVGRTSLRGTPIRTDKPGEVVGIQHDIWCERLTLVVRSYVSSSRTPCEYTELTLPLHQQAVNQVAGASLWER